MRVFVVEKPNKLTGSCNCMEIYKVVCNENMAIKYSNECGGWYTAYNIEGLLEDDVAVRNQPDPDW